MVVDYKLFTKGEKNLQDNLLWVLEQIPWVDLLESVCVMERTYNVYFTFHEQMDSVGVHVLGCVGEWVWGVRGLMCWGVHITQYPCLVFGQHLRSKEGNVLHLPMNHVLPAIFV